jgi:signal transduction histidine kinase
MMLDDVDRLSAFVDDILQASRLAHDRDRVGMDMSEVDLRELLDECATSVAARHKLPEGALRVEMDGDLVAHTDRAALTVVVRNLIDNAVKYSEDPVDVSVRAVRRDGAGPVIEVRDNGIGIPKKDLKRVFNRFYRVPLEGVRSRRGTGLGLFVVSALVRNLGGRVEADSDGPGHGTTMRVKLPSHSAVAPEAA